MVDRVYKTSLPRFGNQLKDLRREFLDVGSKTDWITLRIDPLIRHLNSLKESLERGQFARGLTRLTNGVALFHSDLYFRTNIRELEKLLSSEKSPKVSDPMF